MGGLSQVVRTPIGRALDRVIDRLPEGPKEEDRQGSEFMVVGLACGRDGAVSQAHVQGRDAYGLTAVTLVWAAEQMSAPGYDRVGALGPAAAFDPRAFLDHLGEHDLTWELDRAPAPA